jgi:hypothetical protein
MLTAISSADVKSCRRLMEEDEQANLICLRKTTSHLFKLASKVKLPLLVSSQAFCIGY